MTSEPSISAEGQLDQWIGRSIEIQDELALPLARRIAAMSDLPLQSVQPGSPMPPQWYTMFFSEVAPHAELGPDGHPRKGGFLPPVSLPRRMFAGRKTWFYGDLHIGEPAVKRSIIAAIDTKEGTSGPMTFVTVRHEFRVADELKVVEEQNLVYRGDAPAGARPKSEAKREERYQKWSEPRLLDPVLVFRFSAITFNGHRIHYDADYARDVEHYPGCVMNGALTIHLLVDAARRQKSMQLTTLSARLARPLFVGETITLHGNEQEPGRLCCWATNAKGETAAIVDLEYVP